MLDDYSTFIPTTMERIKRIKSEVPTEEIYKELAEEASELAQAALKMCRLVSETNPTDTPPDEAYNNLVEEYTDVLNIATRLLELEPDWLIGDYKLYRWCMRLDKAKESNSDGCGDDYCNF